MSFPNMNTSLRINKKVRAVYEPKSKDFIKTRNSELHFDKKTTPKQLEKIRINLKKENKRVLIRRIVIFTISISILIYFFGFLKF